jgi:hypothetical protein
MQEDVRDWDWRVRSRPYFEVLRRVHESRVHAGRTPRGAVGSIDLSAEVTVFVATVGAPSYAACLAHLHRQDSMFRLEIVEKVAPLSAALQVMLDRCATRFYVQVDEDMLLQPDAIRRLHQAISAAPPSVALHVAPLYDAHLRRAIHGVKIFRHEIVRRYPFADRESCEKDQIARLQADGYAVSRAPSSKLPADFDDVLGLHGTHWTAESIYERYATLARKLRRHPEKMAWFADTPLELGRRLRTRVSELDYFALMGCLAGLIGTSSEDQGEKDFRRYRELAGLEAAARSWRDWTNEPPARGRATRA